MKRYNQQEKKNITVPAILFLVALAAYYSLFTSSTLAIDSSSSRTSEPQAQYETYTWTLRSNQILDIKIDVSNDYYVDGSTIYQGSKPLCSFSASHVANYQQDYKSAVEEGIIEQGNLLGGTYIISSHATYRGTAYYYLISLNNFYYTITLSSDISLEQAKDCFYRTSFSIQKTA